MTYGCEGDDFIAALKLYIATVRKYRKASETDDQARERISRAIGKAMTVVTDMIGMPSTPSVLTGEQN